MDASEIAVIVVGIAAIVFVVWYFFGKRRQTSATVSSQGLQEVRVTVQGGYTPDVIVVKQGLPVRLLFYRDENASCSEEVRLPDFGVARHLPAYKTTAVEFTPTEPGEFTFTCGMSMLRGKIVVEPAAA